MVGVLRVFQVALGFHWLLSLRWLSLVFATLWQSGSAAVAIRLTGGLAGWSLCVAVADGALAAYVAAGGGAAFHRRRRPGKAWVLAFAICCGVPALALFLTACMVSVSLAPPLLILYFATAAIAVGCGMRGPASAYYAWAVGESIFGVLAGIFYIVAGQFVLENDAGDLDDPRWSWLFKLFFAIAVSSFVSATLQGIVIRSLVKVENNYATSDATREALVVQMLSFHNEPADDNLASPDLPPEATYSAMSNVTAEDGVRGLSGTGAALGARVRATCPLLGFAALYLALLYGFPLLGATSWFIWLNTVGLPGEDYTQDGSEAASCLGCYCTERHSDADIVRVSNVSYGQAVDHLTSFPVDLHMDIYFAVRKGSGRSPAIMLIHGGSFMQGSKLDSITINESYHFARLGFVAFAINYRLESRNPIVQFTSVHDAVHDAKAAVRFMVRHAADYGVDTDRIAVWGESAGGIVAATMNWVVDEGRSGNLGYPSNVTAATGVSGCVWPFIFDGTQRRLLPGELPTPWLDVHGYGDFVVFYVMASMTNGYFKAQGSPPWANRLYGLETSQHVPWGDEEKAIMRPRVQAFLVRALGLSEAEEPC